MGADSGQQMLMFRLYQHGHQLGPKQGVVRHPRCSRISALSIHSMPSSSCRQKPDATLPMLQEADTERTTQQAMISMSTSRHPKAHPATQTQETDLGHAHQVARWGEDKHQPADQEVMRDTGHKLLSRESAQELLLPALDGRQPVSATGHHLQAIWRAVVGKVA